MRFVKSSASIIWCILGPQSAFQMIIRMDIDCTEETITIKQSNEAIPFDKALQLLLNAIQL